MESMAKGRQRLSDITNTTNHVQKTARTLACQENLNLGPLLRPRTENTALLRLLGERNKIIELNALELQKLQVSCQQLQQQNCQLAKANTLMLEFNLGKDRVILMTVHVNQQLKVLQHELGCTEKKELGQDVAVKTTFKEGAVETLHQVGEKAACNPKRKHASRLYCNHKPPICVLETRMLS
ncbi:unnamed protein product [Spirodela intermedia]|uniref:Uncharacterized protein n=1 Tax=Spirodela intermedia TaxID=51605 RepID=A0A7I8J8G6_SPIIN|nr:unnamed protein product [Spirodela intermedia]CAA6666516.1 unnamed protein product [Spirodela intermedia]